MVVLWLRMGYNLCMPGSGRYQIKPMTSVAPQYLTDLHNGKILTTFHLPTGQRRDYEWHAATETVLIHVTNKGQVGTTTQRENWKLGTLQLPMARKSKSFKTNY